MDDSAKKIVFVVDDSPTNLATCQSALSDTYKVCTVASGERMFKLLQKIKPDLILLDVEMPEMNGFEAIGILKENDSYKDIPVIFLSAHGDEFFDAAGRSLGAVDYVAKPFDIPQLLYCLKRYLPEE